MLGNFVAPGIGMASAGLMGRPEDAWEIIMAGISQGEQA
jgi:hypothetical protein